MLKKLQRRPGFTVAPSADWGDLSQAATASAIAAAAPKAKIRMRFSSSIW